jgi:DNA-binding MarR family transcriptional regulator
MIRNQKSNKQNLDQARKESGLSKNEFHAVRYMLQAHRDGRIMGPKDLAVMLNVSNASVTKIVDGLVRKGDFVRAPHPTDRRAQVLEPTVQAAKKIDDAYARYHQVVVEIIDHLPREDNNVLTRTLEQVTNALLDADTSAVFEDEYVVEDHDEVIGDENTTDEDAPNLRILA